MGKKKNKSGALSHEEIWDDSALVRSWDEAVEEYQIYHSIHARGEDVEEVLNRAEKEGLEKLDAGALEEDGEPMEMETGTAGNDPVPTVAYGEQNSAADVKDTQHNADSKGGSALPFPAATGAPGMPNALLGGVQDPALKNLMMAWYFAGYYTGLYEGQRQASQAGGSSKHDG